MTAGGHERFEGDAAAYALGALDEAEVQAFEEHLAGCTPCRDELATMREAVAALALAAPAVTPAAELKERVMVAVQAEATQQAENGQQQAARTPRRRWPAGGWPGWLSPGLAAAALASVAVLAVVGVLVLGGGTAPRTYPGVVHPPGATALLLRSGNTAQLRVRELPAPPAGRLYEVWLKRSGQPPQPTKALFTTTTGLVAVRGSLNGVKAVLVTDEPKPYGSLQPTRAPIIVVPLP